MEATPLALFWAGVIAGAILLYVVLDGFDLGVGVLFGTTREAAHRTAMMHVIAPYWDGNETWLIVVGAGLYAAFPSVYTVFLGAFYFPVLLLLLGLIFRGVAFEFRERANRTRPLWDWGFCLGSTVVAFVQGAALGAMMRGIPVADGQFTGGPFDWLAPFPLLTGLGLVLGYALLGAGWVVLKAEGELRDWAYRRIPWLVGAVLAVLVLAFTLTVNSGEVPRGNLQHRPGGLAFPVLGLLALAGTLYGAQRRRDGLPFALTVLFFLAAYVTLGVMFWPYMVPYSITVASAAAPEPSLSFLFYGAGIVALPVMLIYTIVVYWVFRGKARQGNGN
ncbi:cytochrome d ubiquinol oxidase subunit II [uncultured Thiodictyon sp.]|uniref:cytochrome d ubiquinol oxidase subunit II n=1 Tax=uncultured Thiodictyon sp. TaxID=1846217 RepID=UPI0025F9285E|nr:cytochrome d ubiquinol oxidase subunit II [uncultured Thiodictyon sp.]